MDMAHYGNSGPNSNGPMSISDVEGAIQASYDPKTSNERRKDALAFLETLMNSVEAPQHGISLVNDAALPPQTRLFGLTLLENSLVRRWNQHSLEEAETIRKWVIGLVQPLRPQDPSYLRLKIASLWVVLAERTWASSWDNLDAMLQELWDTRDTSQQLTCNRTFVLYVLESLSENICVREDPIAMLRQAVLGQSLNDIFIPPALYKKHNEERGDVAQLRQGNHGWLLRICALIQSLTTHYQPESQPTVVRALEALKPTVSWISLEAIVEANCIECIADALSCGDETILIAAIELLLAILGRPYLPHFVEPWTNIYRTAVSPNRIELLKHLFSATQTDPDDIDDTKYTARKKLSEVVAHLADAMTRFPDSLVHDDDHIIAFYQFAIDICKSDSLLVSIPVLHSLAQTLAVGQPKVNSILRQGASQLFDTCVERMIRFDMLPKHIDHPILTYLREDFETLPEMHAFLGNYRRYSLRVIENLSLERPVEAVQYMLQQTVATFKAVEDIRDASYTKHAIPVVQLEANSASVRGGLSGYRRWLETKRIIIKSASDDEKPEHEQEIAASIAALSDHCISVSNVATEHPDVARTICQLMVDIVLNLPKPTSSLVRGVVQHILKVNLQSRSKAAEFEEAYKQMEHGRLQGIRHLALILPDAICEDHEEIFHLIERIGQDQTAEEKIRWGYRGVLVMLTQRSSLLDEQSRLSRLEPMLQPIVGAWTSPGMTDALSSFSQFCSLIGVDNLITYVTTARFYAAEDWANTQLDDSGKQLRESLLKSLSDLPLRMTNSLLSASTEALNEQSTAYRVGLHLWQRIMPVVLPNILTLLSHATAFYSEASWTHLPAECQAVIRKMLVDRFWQSGISCETKDEFAARISESSNTYEGFASIVRGTPRQIRDGCYHIIHGMVRFEKAFFAIPNLAEPLAAALFDNAHCLSTHHLQRLVPLLDRIITRCPPSKRATFLPPLIVRSFRCFRTKLVQEWSALELAQKDQQQDEQSGNLNDEMKADSVVRATTHAFVTFVNATLSRQAILDPPPHDPRLTLQWIILTHPECAQEVLAFVIESLRMRDSRCVGITTQILRLIVPFATKQQDPAVVDLMSAIRHKLATDALQTAIMSLNEPHFVDIHKELAATIASIIHHCGAIDDTPMRVLESLQGMDPERLRHSVEKILKMKKERDQRAIVLDLLAGIRGVRISELGKVGIGGNRDDATRRAKNDKSKWLARMDVENNSIVRGNTPPEGGLGDLFGV